MVIFHCYVSSPEGTQFIGFFSAKKHNWAVPPSWYPYFFLPKITGKYWVNSAVEVTNGYTIMVVGVIYIYQLLNKVILRWAMGTVNFLSNLASKP